MAMENTGKSAARVAAELCGVRRLFFIGIGGVHMASLALLAREEGFEVSGSDRQEGEGTRMLRAAGVPVRIGHDAAHLAGAQAVVFTLAISPDNAEYAAAVGLGLPLFSRADFLGYLMASAKRRIGVAGCHGKSTVTAWLGQLLDLAGRSPRVLCGAPMRYFGAPFASGTGEEFVFEACEYRRSFLCFSPTVAVLLNVELDHVDCFGSLDEVIKAFSRFAALTGEAGVAVYNADDKGAAKAASAAPRRIGFGMGEDADYRAVDIRLERGIAAFAIRTPHGLLPRVQLRVAGRHQIENALAVAAVADLLGVDGETVAKGLSSFCGAGRRMEYRGLYCGARVYDDYAHHPTEVATVLRTARELAGSGRLFAVFQPHTYSRTAAFYDELCAALRLADRVLVASVYAARERDTLGVSAAGLAFGVGERASFVGGMREIAATLAAELCPGDLLLVMGAGDIDRIFGEFSGKDFTLPEK